MPKEVKNHGDCSLDQSLQLLPKFILINVATFYVIVNLE
jgi:hypothetical protein